MARQEHITPAPFALRHGEEVTFWHGILPFSRYSRFAAGLDSSAYAPLCSSRRTDSTGTRLLQENGWAVRANAVPA